MKRNMLRRAAAALLLLTLAFSCVQAQGAVAWGSRGNDVSRVQSKLKQYGYYSGAVDGIFGQATYDAVIWFQKKNSLKADGVVGSATAAALGLSLNGGSVSAAAATESEAYLLARLVHGEARGESYTGEVAVAAVVLNRVRSAAFPNTISGVIFQSGAFDCVADGQLFNQLREVESLLGFQHFGIGQRVGQLHGGGHNISFGRGAVGTDGVGLYILGQGFKGFAGG